MRPVVPDVSLWARITELFSLLGAFQAVVLMTCVAGVSLSSLAWAGGRIVGVGGMSTAGKLGVMASLGCAFLVAALPGLIGWVISIFS